MTAPPSQLHERLVALCGAEHVSAEPETAVHGLHAALSVAPGSLEEVAAVLQAAAVAGAAVVPLGGGTQQRIGVPPARLDLLLSTGRLQQIVEWEPADLTAGLQAGMTLAAVQAALAEQGQQLPIDAPLAASATLGGLIATNTAGPRRWRYGGWRDLVIGMHMALADGTTIKSGGRVVKNVQGYDLGKPFTGALGTLGLIGQIHVKLVPLPARRRLLVGRGALGAVAAFLDSVAASTLRATAVDLLNAAAANACGLRGADYAGLVLLEGSVTTVDGQALGTRRPAVEAGVRLDAIEESVLAPIWQAWVDLGRVDDLTPSEALLTVAARPSEVAEVVEAVTRTAAAHALLARLWARAGNGAVYTRLHATAGDAVAALAAAQADLLQRWPATTLTAGDPAVARAARPWGAEPTGLAVMRTLKQRFDPAGILQPGRYVGGI